MTKQPILTRAYSPDLLRPDPLRRASVWGCCGASLCRRAAARMTTRKTLWMTRVTGCDRG